MIRETENTVDFLLGLKLLSSFFFVKMNDVLLTIANNCRMKIKFVEAIDCVVVAAWLHEIHVAVAHRLPIETLQVIYFNAVDYDWCCEASQVLY